ncbi:hypothetical protein D5086_014169 [Populus alba]|uniref:Uncharacterized protein n=1 Tax=Populus alba TaxID=43335 RepID=A0ACC4C7T3_POPAL
MTLSKNVYSKNDTMISYLLLVGAVLLDCYSSTVFFTSDKAFHIVGRICFPLQAFFRKRKRWSSSMGQHNLISAQTKKPMSKLLEHFMRKWKIPSPVNVNKDLKELIFKQVKDTRSRYDPDTDDFLVLLKLLEERGRNALQSKGFFREILGWSSLETQDGWANEKKWEMISEVWVEMLMYAASHCGWKEHADALARGGELLTHVCLLMAHLGLRMIKYGERIWVFKRNKESNNLSRQPSAKLPSIQIEDIIFSFTESSSEVRYLHEARLLFNTSKMLFQNLDLVNFDQEITYDLFSEKKAEEAFHLTEIELGLKYDRLYSKVATVSWHRFIIRSVTFLSSIFALVSFSIMIKSKSVYSKNDRIISYVLLSGVVCLESYSIIGHLFSDWPMIWLIRLEKAFPNLYRTRCFSLLLSFSRKRKRWSRLMGQHNLIRALSKKPVNKLRKKYFPGNWNIHSRVDADKNLKELIFKQVMDKRSRYESSKNDPDTSDLDVLHKLLEERGSNSLLSKCCLPKLGWSSLESSESLDGWENEKKWEMISEVWVEMLMYAASHCGWKEHADALARGGELLTHVCLLMAHLGLSKQCPPEESDELDARDKRLYDFLGPVVFGNEV